MRLIDADALIKTIDSHCYPVRYDITSIEPGMTQIGILQAIQEQPTIEPERKKGEWIIKDNPGTGWYRVTCSECGEDVTSTAPCIGFYPNAKVTWDYCPNCGADMRGDQNED